MTFHVIDELTKILDLQLRLVMFVELGGRMVCTLRVKHCLCGW